MIFNDKSTYDKIIKVIIRVCQNERIGTLKQARAGATPFCIRQCFYNLMICATLCRNCWVLKMTTAVSWFPTSPPKK